MIYHNNWMIFPSSDGASEEGKIIVPQLLGCNWPTLCSLLPWEYTGCMPPMLHLWCSFVPFCFESLWISEAQHTVCMVFYFENQQPPAVFLWLPVLFIFFMQLNVKNRVNRHCLWQTVAESEGIGLCVHRIHHFCASHSLCVSLCLKLPQAWYTAED